MSRKEAFKGVRGKWKINIGGMEFRGVFVVPPYIGIEMEVTKSKCERIRRDLLSAKKYAR